MAAVELRLRELADASHPLLHAAAAHLVEAGGKRFRPLVTLLAGQLGQGDRHEVVDAAVVVELTHLATLYHDDVMDEAAVRRGAQSANTRWTNTVAILTGDYLFSRASDLVSDLGVEAVKLQSRTFSRLVVGQVGETAGPAEGEDPVAHHLQVIADKTGSLIATSARLGALLAGAPADQTEIVARWAELVGVAFQLSDDIIDVASDREQSGKTPGTDLREGIRTLPALLVLAGPEKVSDPAEVRLRELVARPLPDDAEHAEALALLRGSPALVAAREVLGGYVAQAREVADVLPPSAVRDALLALADYVVVRTG